MLSVQMKTLIAYYSRKGSNKFLARKIAGNLDCDLERIRPRLDVFLFFLLKIHLGNWPLKHRVEDYERVILVGPVWMGRFIPPLKNFVLKYSGRIRHMVFVTCCGSSYSQKDDRFGHGLVFNEIKEIMGEKLDLCQAFPIGLVLPDDQKEDTDAFMKAHLNEGNFKGEIAGIYEEFIKKL